MKINKYVLFFAIIICVLWASFETYAHMEEVQTREEQQKYEDSKKKIEQEIVEQEKKIQDEKDRLKREKQAEIDRLEKERLDSVTTKFISATSGLNVRHEPNAESAVLKTLPLNHEVTSYRVVDNEEWRQIEIDGVWYYINGKYLSDEKTIIKPTVKTTTTSSHTATTTASNGGLLGYYELTAYCNCSKCCGQWAGGATASGVMPIAGVTAASNSIPMGTRINIEGYGTFTIHDTGGMASNVIDLYFNSHQEALNFGRKHGVAVYMAQ